MNATEADLKLAFSRIVPDWFLDRLDTRLGTADVVPLLKQAGTLAVSADVPDGEYPEWSHHVECTSRGYSVQVIHHEEVVREGLLAWNNLANRSTIGALERRRQAAPAVDGQLVMPL